MASEKQSSANRANARASTGPKTVSGKARAARNAHQHGLSNPIASDPLLSHQAATLVAKLGADGVDPEIRDLLRSFVEAQLDVNRVRRVRYELITKAYDDPRFEPQQSFMRRARLLHILKKNIRWFTDEDVRKVIQPTLEGGDKYGAVVLEFGRKLMSLERYERRALSRRKFAIRALDAAGFQWPRTLDEGLLKLIGS